MLVAIGSGPPLVLIPGLQGRWEWMAPAVEALARSFRVFTFSLADERRSGHAFRPELGFDNYVVQIDRVLEEAGEPAVALCGVSYGGLIALRYAALRPARATHLILASALVPEAVPHERVRFYDRAPRLLFPLFCVASSRRVTPEIRSALPRLREQLSCGFQQTVRVLRAPASPQLMIQRLKLIDGMDVAPMASRVAAPTLVLTGEPGLDRTVPVEATRRYLDLIPGSQLGCVERTGHLATITRPQRFAELIRDFVAQEGSVRTSTTGAARPRAS
jgi:3-oxoadipate enol-lactonase